MQVLEIQSVIDEIFGLYAQYGQADYIGEPVSQIEHMSQSAQLAMAGGYEDEVVLAAFFHDIGHICLMNQRPEKMGNLGVVRHEKIGAAYLRNKGFSEKIAQLVENHVQAKRYLTYKYPEYYAQLSEASKQTLEYQGGKMSQEEAEAFELDDLFELSIQLRKWDELAKIENIPLNNLDKLRYIALQHLMSLKK
ncbi:MAG: HDIG domain-containing protein [Microscillaceae bacterium]|jgi:phosphonate degradation associated HDIG domain protein|nr:HDIG domain-containing protein [Microscillaceae bacterium]